MRPIIISFVLIIIFSLSVSADVLDSSAIVLPGSKIKVVTKSEKEATKRSRSEYKYTEYKGRFIERTENSITIQTESDIVTLQNSDISLLYTSNKRKTNFGKGFVYGGLAGFTFGAIAGFAEPFEICIFGPCDPPTTSERIRSSVGFGILFGVTTGLVGGIVGAFVKTDKWETVKVEQLQFSIEPVYNDRVGLNLTLRF